MGSGHDHGTTAIRHEKPLWWALGLTGGFLIAEVIGAFLTNSLALLSDAAHMGTDTVALMIALTAVRLSRRPADAKRSFGYARMEAMGAMANGLMLFAVAGYILYEAVGRFAKPAEIATTGMVVIASLGLAVNLIAMRLLRAGSGESLNMKGAYLEVWSDMLGSVAVIAGAIAIRYTGWAWIDPVLAVLIGLWVLPRTWTLLREAGNVLMEGVPKGIDLDAVRALLASTAGIDGAPGGGAGDGWRGLAAGTGQAARRALWNRALHAADRERGVRGRGVRRAACLSPRDRRRSPDAWNL